MALCIRHIRTLIEFHARNHGPDSRIISHYPAMRHKVPGLHWSLFHQITENQLSHVPTFVLGNANAGLYDTLKELQETVNVPWGSAIGRHTHFSAGDALSGWTVG